MRTKTLLLFVFLFTGMAFSQQGDGEERFDFTGIRMILNMQHRSHIATYIERLGYEKSDEGFRKGDYSFRISLPDKGPFTYSEDIDDKARYDELLKDALAYGMVVTTKNSRGEYELKGRGYYISISKRYFIMKKL